jgi:D-alanine--D-alanine ligase
MRLQSEVKEWFGRETDLPATGRIHFVGIGGAGMSALARILLHQGREVSGSDTTESSALDDLRARGASIRIGHDADNIKGAAAVCVSDAIGLKENPETRSAREGGIRLLRRSQLLGQVLRGHRVIAITGSHGKSTTTAILAQILTAAGMDPLAIVGADVPGFDGNVRLGKGEIAVVEACEAYNSLQDIQPETVLLTNLEPEHLDFHKTWEALLESVRKFAASATGRPKLVYCADDAGACQVAQLIPDSIPYDSKQELRGLRVLGHHNALNARGAIETASLYGVREEVAIRAAQGAAGCARRLEHKATVGKIEVFDDYAHHPTEIRASLRALRDSFPGRRLVVVFQPHLYSRTRDQLDAFAPSFADADVVVITDIYPAREAPIPGVSASLIVERLEQRGIECMYVPSRYLLPREVAKLAKENDLVVGMGAGNIESFAPSFVEELARNDSPLRVAVFGGGDSAEREVSLLSANMVEGALKSMGCETQRLDPTEMLLGAADLSPLVGSNRPDIVFIALHGTGAEDGGVQGLLESLHIPYTGSGVLASALAMDKARAKLAMEAAGIPTPAGVLVRRGDRIPTFRVPCVVKPNAQGSTIGLSFVRDETQLVQAVRIAHKYCDEVLIEELVSGTEISVPVLVDRALPAVEIVPRSGSYDFSSKYTPGETEEIVPARISDEQARLAAEYALAAHKAVGAEDVSRTDMIVSESGVKVLEINTLPGMTATSLLPRSAQGAGIDYPELCMLILKSAMKRHGIEKR